MKISLIISVYKKDDFLRLILESVLRQNLPPDEVIVAEDGEDSKMNLVYRDYESAFKDRLKIVRHQDIGNRKPLIVNKAVAQSTGDYLVFIDGDCVLRKDFIADHLKLSEKDSFLTGRRVELSPGATQLLTPLKIQTGYLDNFPIHLYWDAICGRTQYLGRFFKTPFFLRKLLKRDHVLDIRGCNLSLSREAFEKVNGYSNDFSGAYGEDSDLEYRLRFAGYKMKGNKGACIQFHLWHPTQNHDLQNQSRLQQVLKEKRIQAISGLRESLDIP